MTEAQNLTIFVHRASECLTDHESHGDGLICFSLLNGLAERGHRIYAYADTAAIQRRSPNLHVRVRQHQAPANSLAPWEQAWRANHWREEVERQTPIDLVWRMHPYGGGCPVMPKTGGRPLVVGPLFYDWPKLPGDRLQTGKPRLGIGLQGVLGSAASAGWQRTLNQAALILCATEPHAEAVQRQHPGTAVALLPVIVEPPQNRVARTRSGKRLSLLFAANLVPNKNPMIFCETIQRLRAAGVEATGTILGEGPERPALEAFCTASGLNSIICFRGKVPNGAVYEALLDADFLVSASRGEPYGRGIAEAMSVGTPAICHRSGGPSDFIRDGQDGLLVGDLTAKAYTACLQDALSGSETWNRLSAAALKKAKQWSASVVLDTLEAQLRQVTQIGQVKT